MKKLLPFLLLIAFSFSGTAFASSAGSGLEGKILLQVQEHGEAWYIKDGQRYYMKDGNVAYQMMRFFGLGITNIDLTKMPVVLSAQEMRNSESACGDSDIANRLKGKILLQVEEHGEAWYVDTEKCRMIYMKDGAAAYEIMRYLSLGITNADLGKIDVGDSSVIEVDDSTVVINDSSGAVSTDGDIHYAIVDTNQSQCFNTSSQIACPTSGSFSGQDAQYAGLTPSYTNNGDGTVTDNRTGLMWIQDAGSKFNYYDGISYAQNVSFAGYSDWRVPTIKELYSLIDFSGQDIDPMASSAGNPFIDNDAFVFEYGDTSNGDRIIDSQWITSNLYVSTVMGNQECFFGVNFADGRIKCYPTRAGGNNGYFLRLVRGNTSYGMNDLQADNFDTITDKATGLMWQRYDNAEPLLWENALAYCENLNLGGYTDWRLPNAKELQSLVDYSRSPDTTNSPAISDLFGTTEIVNEAGAKDYPFFWTSTTHKDQTGGSTASYISFGRALGYMNGTWIDVHGAGAQRSDPKSGNVSDYPTGHGPQGDAIRISNYVRCVRGGNIVMSEGDAVIDNGSGSGVMTNPESSTPQQTGGSAPMPPAEAISACSGMTDGAGCSFQTPQGTISGTCRSIESQIACVP